MGSLEKFGEFVVATFRDTAIDKIDGLLIGRWKAPGLLALQADLANMTTEEHLIVRRCVLEVVDGSLHDFLFALHESHDGDQGIAVIVDGQNVAALSDGLQGELYSDDGWFSRFSKHGPHPSPA